MLNECVKLNQTIKKIITTVKKGTDGMKTAQICINIHTSTRLLQSAREPAKKVCQFFLVFTLVTCVMQTIQSIYFSK